MGSARVQFAALYLVISLWGGCVERSSYVSIDEHDKVAQFITTSEPESLGTRVDARLEDKIVLLGWDVDKTAVEPGGEVVVTWYWKCVKPAGPGWRLFTHIFDADQKPRMNQDGVGPIRKAYQPEHWKPGMVVRDEQRFGVPADWNSVVFEPRVGLWRDDDRMALRSGPDGGNDRVKGPRVAVLMESSSEVRAPFATTKPVIDGNVEGDPAWQRAATLQANLQTMSGKIAPFETEVRLLWDEEHLYIAVRAEDDHLESPFKEHDDELWRADAFEVFLDPSGDSKDYYEIQVNPAGVVFDSHLPTYRKNQNAWSSGARVATRVHGDLNGAQKADRGWDAEMALPWKNLLPEGKTPSDTRWSANFFRVDKTKERTRASAWSPPLRGDFHALDRFGQLILLKPGEGGGDNEVDTASDS